MTLGLLHLLYDSVSLLLVAIKNLLASILPRMLKETISFPDCSHQMFGHPWKLLVGSDFFGKHAHLHNFCKLIVPNWSRTH